MLGAVSAGVCAALKSLGLLASFDVVYGSSAGALNASYAVAGQARGRIRLYVLAAEAGLVDPRRALLGRRPLRLAELVNGLLRAHPHDDRVLNGTPPLRVFAERVEDNGLDLLPEFDSVAEVRQAVWASCAIPVFAGDILDFRGTSYVDGGLVESIPTGSRCARARRTCSCCAPGPPTSGFATIGLPPVRDRALPAWGARRGSRAGAGTTRPLQRRDRGTAGSPGRTAVPNRPPPGGAPMRECWRRARAPSGIRCGWVCARPRTRLCPYRAETWRDRASFRASREPEGRMNAPRPKCADSTRPARGRSKNVDAAG
jgi:Patatin-like phospholipase